MKKKSIRHYSLVLTALWSIALFTACQKDDVVEQNQQETTSEVETIKPNSVSIVNKKEIITDTLFKELVMNSSLAPYVTISTQEFKSNATIPFRIETNQARKTVTDNTTIFTFSLQTHTTSIRDIDNLVLVNTKGEKKLYWYTYHFTPEIYRAYTSVKAFSVELPYTMRELSADGTIGAVSKSTITLKNDEPDTVQNRYSCQWVARSFPYYCSCANHGPWVFDCTCSPKSGWVLEWKQVCGSGNESGSQNGPLSMGFLGNFGEISIARGGALNGSGPDGGLGGGDGGEITIPFLSPREAGILAFSDLIGLTARQENWLLLEDNDKIIPKLDNLLYENGFSDDSKNLIKEIVEFGRINNNEESKQLIGDLLSAIDYNTSINAINLAKDLLNILKTGTIKQKKLVKAILDNDADRTTAILLDGAEFSLLQCCSNDQTPEIMAQITAEIIIDFLDSGFNAFNTILEVFRTDKSEGRFVRRIMEETGIDVPVEIEDETLGSLFKVRKRNRELIVEPYGEWYTPILDIGFTALDLLAIISPSTNGGAFLAVKGGGKITAKALSDYLKVLANGQWKTVNESMSDAAKSYQEFISGRRWNESFEMPGPVKFDGIKDGVLVEAKSGHLNFVDANGNFKPFFNGQDAIITQARRQREAVGDSPIEWHFEHNIVRQAFKDLLQNRGFNIIFIHTPR